MTGDDGNAAQRLNWNELNGRKWLAHEAVLEASHAPMGTLLLERAALRAGERVLEVGCGTGTLLTRMSEAVGSAGSVSGADISKTLLEQAARRVPPGVRLIEADAQQDDLGGPYDAVLSRFGVMFFAEPVAAFAHMRAAAPGGRLCFVCWAPVTRNPRWARPLRIAAAHLGAPEPSVPGAPGPFALDDPDRVRRILDAAGWRAVEVDTRLVPPADHDAAQEAVVAMAVGPAGALIRERAPAPEVLAAIEAELVAGWQAEPACVHLVTARA